MTWLFFLIFLAVYGYQQYFTPPPDPVTQPFVMNALLVLSITVIAPFFISYLFTRATQLTGRVPAILLGFISAVGLSVFGYWIIWKYFGGVGDARSRRDRAENGPDPGRRYGRHPGDGQLVPPLGLVRNRPRNCARRHDMSHRDGGARAVHLVYSSSRLE